MTVAVRSNGSAPSQQGGSSFSGVTVTLPSNAVVGDIAVVAIQANNLDNSFSGSPPSGWTALVLNFFGIPYEFNTYLGVFYKVIAAGDAGSSVAFPMSSAVIDSSMTLVSTTTIYSGVNNASPIDAQSLTVVGGTNNPQYASHNTTPFNVPVTTVTANAGIVGVGTGQKNPITSAASQATQAKYSGSGVGFYPAASIMSTFQAGSGTPGVNNVVMAGSASGFFDYFGISFALKANLLPIAPTLLSPAVGAYTDLGGTPTFAWAYSSGTTLGTQTAYAFRQKVGAGSYQYWNAAGGTWSGTIVWNTSASQSITFPALAFANGNTYSWSVATQDAQGQGGFATDQTVTGQAIPTVTVTAPTGSVGTLLPTVLWTNFLAGSASQIGTVVKIFSAAQYGAVGFDPSISTPTYSVSLGTGTFTSHTLTSALVNGVSYRAYVQIVQTGNQASLWTAFSAFTISVVGPVTPTLTAVVAADPTSGSPVINLTVATPDNLLTANQASIETDATGWAVVANCTLTQSSTLAEDGTFSLRVSVTGASTATAKTTPVTAVTPLKTYTGLLNVRAGATGRVTSCQLLWYKIDGVTPSSVRASDSSSTATTTVGSWTQFAVTAVAPSDAAFCMLQVTIIGSSDLHYVDEAGVFPGTISTWTPGGFAGQQILEVDYSDDGGATWKPTSFGKQIAVTAPDETYAFTDSEAPLNVLRTYRAYTTAVVFGISVSSGVASASGTCISTTWWLRDPMKPADDVAIDVDPGFQFDIDEQQGVFHALGNPYAIVVADAGGIGGSDGSQQQMVIHSYSLANYKLIRTQLLKQQRLLLQSAMDGDQWYIRILDRTITLAHGGSQRDIQLKWIEQAH